MNNVVKNIRTNFCVFKRVFLLHLYIQICQEHPCFPKHIFYSVVILARTITFFLSNVHSFRLNSHIKRKRGKQADEMKRFSIGIILCFTLFISTGCLKGESQSNDHSYDTTKKMVLDIIQTDDGKKALVEVLSEEELKDALILDNDVVKQTILEVLNSEEGAKTWSQYFSDPNFAQEFASSMEDSHKNLINTLMNDANFQKHFLDVLQNPEVSLQMVSALKSQQFREHLEQSIEEALNSPAFQANITETLLNAAEKKGEGGEEGGEGGSEEQEPYAKEKEE